MGRLALYGLLSDRRSRLHCQRLYHRLHYQQLLESVAVFAAATLFPNYQFYIFFIIPVKLKWLGWINAALHILLLIVETPAGRAAMLFALLNYFIFFGKTMFNTVGGFFGRNVRKTQFQLSKRQGERQNRHDVISKEDRDYWKNR